MVAHKLKMVQSVTQVSRNNVYIFTTGDTSAVVQEKISAMMDVSRVSALLKAAEEDRDHIKQRYEIEIEQRKELEGIWCY